jgi:ATPase subunit of ABC transporter with duplicated ATPase domains
MSSPIIVGRGVSHELATGRELFANLNFELHPIRAALVGPNGVGKTTLARIVAGELSATSGNVRRHGSITFLPQRVAPPAVKVSHYLADVDEWSPLSSHQLDAISQDAPCTELSGGEWTRLRLARALNADYLILDEPSNDLDRDGRKILHEFLTFHSRGALLISHDREFLTICDEVLELSSHEQRDQERANLAAALDVAKRERDAVQARRVEQQARQERRNQRGAAIAARGGAPRILLGTRKRRAQASTGKIDGDTSQRAAAAVRRAHQAFTQLKLDARMNAELLGSGVPAQKLIAEAQAFNIRHDDWVFSSDIDFSWRGNVRLAVQGRNGAGKSTLLRALAGDAVAARGELRRGNVRALYLDQRCSSLDDHLSVLDNMRAASPRTETEIRNALARFLFTKEAVFQPAHTLSGGERLRAALARGFLSVATPEMLLLDEPTNNLDLTNVEFLESFVSEFPGALIVVSHDVTFLEHCRVEEILML